MTRKDELLQYLNGTGNDIFINRMVDEVVFLENQLEDLRKLPFIKVNPKDKQMQKTTPASRLYVSLMAQYNANIRTLASLTGKNDIEEESPLRAWVKSHADR